MRGRRILGRVIMLGIVAAVIAAPVAAQTLKVVPAKPTATLEGADTYRQYCATCHGVTGTGNGPAAGALKTAPPDLTRLTKKAGGNFPTKNVEDAVLGSNKVLSAHGSTDMPIWGPIFKSLSSSEPELVTLRMSNLIDHLKTLQK